MSDLTFGERAKVALNPGQILRVTTSGAAEVEILEGGPLGTTTVTAASQEFGPYSTSARLIVKSVSGPAAYGLHDYVSTITAAQVQTVQAAIDAGQLDVFAGSKLPTLAGVPVGSITLNAGSGNTVSALRLTFAPPTDTIGAQRLLVPTDETFVLAVGSTRSFTIDELAGAALVMHAVGVSSSTTYTGAAYVIGSAEADLADALANDARLEWLSDDVARVDVTVEQGATAQTAIVSILGWTR